MSDTAWVVILTITALILCYCTYVLVTSYIHQELELNDAYNVTSYIYQEFTKPWWIFAKVIANTSCQQLRS